MPNKNGHTKSHKELNLPIKINRSIKINEFKK